MSIPFSLSDSAGRSNDFQPMVMKLVASVIVAAMTPAIKPYSTPVTARLSILMSNHTDRDWIIGRSAPDMRPHESTGVVVTALRRCPNDEAG